MRRKLYWGVAVLIVILFTVGVFLLTQRNIDMEPEIILGEETKQLLKDMEKQHKEVSSQDAAKLPPPGASWNGHWRDREHRIDDKPGTNEIAPQQVSGVLTKAQQKELQQFWTSQGLDPPPRGHGWEFDADGNASLFKYNEPYFEMSWSEKFYPGQDFNKLNEDEWIRYNVLLHIVSGSVLRLDSDMIKLVRAGHPVPKETYAPGVVELAEEWKVELEQKASGPVPQVSTTISWNREPTQKELAEIDRQENELLVSMSPPKRLNPEWSHSVDTIVKELEAEVQKRR